MSENPQQDEFTELVDADITRVDAVGKAANGTTILLAKSAEGEPVGLFAPEFVRDLVAKADAGATPPTGERVTVSGSPDAIARMIHQAAAGQRVVKATQPEYVAFVKAKYSAEEKRDLASQGHAMRNSDGEPDYPIDDEEDLGKAIHAVGRGGADHDKIRRYVIRRAREMGKPDQIPDDWAADGSLKTPVAKADGDSEPGSPAWEAQDAESAEQVLASVLALRPRIEALAQREGTEVGAGHMEDLGDVIDLQGAQDCLTQAAKLLGGFAVSERAEAGASVTKAAEPPTPTAASAAPSPQESTVTDTRAVEATAAAPASAPAETVAKSDGALTEAELAAIGRDYLRKMAAEKATETSGATALAEDARVIPGTETVQAPAQAPEDVMKAAATQLATVFGEAIAPVAKQLGELAAQVGSQTGRVEKALAQPDDRRSPLLNGATGAPGLAPSHRGTGFQDRPEFEPVRKALDALPDGPQKEEAQREVAIAAIKGRFSR
jgi:hypothetical protein